MCDHMQKFVASLVKHSRSNVRRSPFNPAAHRVDSFGGKLPNNSKSTIIDMSNLLAKTFFFFCLTEPVTHTERIQQVENEKQIDGSSRH